jgi:hypothetical protein
MRAVMYVLSILAQDEETQRKGCVGILMNIDPFWRPIEKADNFRLPNLMCNLGPVRYGGFHFCVSRKTMISNPVTQSILSAMTSQIFARSVRFRFHSGTSTSGVELGLDLTCFYYRYFNIDLLVRVLFCRLIT